MSTVSQVPKVVGYPRAEGAPVADIVSRTPPSPPSTRRLWWLLGGLLPPLVPFAVWASITYWRMPRSQTRWIVISAIVLTLEIANFVGFMIYGYGRHYLVPPAPDYL